MRAVLICLYSLSWYIHFFPGGWYIHFFPGGLKCHWIDVYNSHVLIESFFLIYLNYSLRCAFTFQHANPWELLGVLFCLIPGRTKSMIILFFSSWACAYDDKQKEPRSLCHGSLMVGYLLLLRYAFTPWL